MSERWNRFDAELDDLLQEEARKRGKRVPCRYCGHPTTRKDGVCPAHDDLPDGEPETLVAERMRAIEGSEA